MRKLSQEARETQAKWVAEDSERMRTLEGAVYTMIGGGWIGGSAISQPSSFYIDDRVGRRPYPKRAIYQAVEILALARKFAGIKEPYDPDVKLPNLGIF